MRAVVYDRYGPPESLRVEEVPTPSPTTDQVLLRVVAVGMLVVPQGPTHFGPLADLCVAGDVGIHIDRTFGLDEVPEAMRHVGEGLALGKVVVAID